MQLIFERQPFCVDRGPHPCGMGSEPSMSKEISRCVTFWLAFLQISPAIQM